VCLGNELRGDDGVGIQVGRLLEQLELPEGVEVELHASAGLDLVDTVLSSDLLVLVDALRTSTVAPGTCITFEVDHPEQVGTGSGPGWCHGFGLPRVLEVARRMRPGSDLPRIVVIGVEILVKDRFETGLSEPVSRALPELLSLVLQSVEAPSGRSG
jgi:hydrogenase maturation protease